MRRPLWPYLLALVVIVLLLLWYLLIGQPTMA